VLPSHFTCTSICWVSNLLLLQLEAGRHPFRPKRLCQQSEPVFLDFGKDDHLLMAERTQALES
jgi:hypothetical protein